MARVVEVSLSNNQAKLFRSLVAALQRAQEQVNMFATAVFASQDVDGDVENIQFVEGNGTAKLSGVVPPRSSLAPAPMTATAEVEG